MKILLLVISFSAVLFISSFAYAGPGHSHSHGHHHGGAAKLDDAGILSSASKGVSTIIKRKQLIEGKELSLTWDKIPETAKSINKKGRGYSIAKFENKKSKQNLFILLSDVGEIYDANFTGKFKELKE